MNEEEELRRYVGRKVLLHFLINDQLFHYRAIILAVNDKFITFKDKFGDVFTYRTDLLRSVQELRE